MSAAQPRPQSSSPCLSSSSQCESPHLVLRAQMGLSRCLETSLQMLAVLERLQVTLQAWSISSRLQVKQTSQQAMLRLPLREHRTALPLPQASGATGQTPSAPAPTSHSCSEAREPGSLTQAAEKRASLGSDILVTC